MDDDVLHPFGERLKRLRMDANISQEDLAHRASLDRTYISLLERGKRNPTLVCLVKIARSLDIPLAELCSFDR